MHLCKKQKMKYHRIKNLKTHWKMIIRIKDVTASFGAV